MRSASAKKKLWRATVRSANIALKKVILALRLRPSYVWSALHQFIAFGHWCRTNGLEKTPRFDDRFEMFKYVHDAYLKNEPIDYLEFGVFAGDSIRRWLELNTHPESRFFGFDSFQGLPEAWKHRTRTLNKGHFSTNGATPDIRDARVQFVRGFFQESLEPFLETWRPRNRLVIHLDADLYTSTLYVLCTLNRHLIPGTFLFFDEFAFVTEEFRALVDYTSAFGRTAKPVANAGEFYNKICFEIVPQEAITARNVPL